MCAWKVFIVRGLGLLCNVKHGCFEQKMILQLVSLSRERDLALNLLECFMLAHTRY